MKKYNYEHYTNEEMNEIRKANLETMELMTYDQRSKHEDKIAKLLNW